MLLTSLVKSKRLCQNKKSIIQAFFLKGKGNIHGVSKRFTLGYS